MIIRKLFSRIAPKIYIQLIFFKNYRKFANIRNPQELYEKLLWLNFYDKRDIKTRLADKYSVRGYLKDLGYENYLNDLHGVYEAPEDIDFPSLPYPCILKCNHGANFNIHLDDYNEDTADSATKDLVKWMKTDYSLEYSELHYRDIPRRIICEKHLGYDLYDYKVYCFNGKPEYVMICRRHTSKKTEYFFYTFDWEYKDFLYDHHPDPNIKKPELLSELYSLSAKLSDGFPFVRIDTYIQENRLIFGEMTFTPSGFIDIETLPEIKLKFGDMVNLNKK